MRHVIQFLFLACTLPSEFAVAETYRCIMNREFRVHTDGSVENNKEAAKGVEFYIAIDNKTDTFNKTEKGTFTICSEKRCFKDSDVEVNFRWDDPRKTSPGPVHCIGRCPDDRQLRFTRNFNELWRLDGRKDTGNFDAIAVGFSGSDSSTSFGSCRLVIQ